MEMSSYPAGTPSWVDIGVPDMDQAIAFYGALFGWTFDDADDGTGGYRQARLRGHSVAGFGPATNPGPPVWSTYVAVDDAAATEAAIVAAGGTVVVPVMDVMGFGHMGVYTDDQGAFISTWQPGTHPGAGLVNEVGTWCWNELMTRDPEAAKAFYGAVFGWSSKESEATMTGPAYVEWQLGGREIGGMMPMVGDMWPPELPNHWMVYFTVADTEAACAQIGELGGTVTVEPFDTPAGRVAVVNDPAGATFSIIALSDHLTEA